MLIQNAFVERIAIPLFVPAMEISGIVPVEARKIE